VQRGKEQGTFNRKIRSGRMDRIRAEKGTAVVRIKGRIIISVFINLLDGELMTSLIRRKEERLEI